MPVKTRPYQSNFSRGEWSPQLEGRVDLEGYKDSAHEITNWIITISGGLLVRGGWHFVSEVKTSAKETRLIPFEYSELQNYIVEVGDQYFRFYMDSGQIELLGVPYEIVGPYYEDEIWDIRFGQDDKYLYLVHPDVQRQQLNRLSNTNWFIRQLDSDDGPYLDEITSATITPSATTGEITLTAIPGFGSDMILGSAFPVATHWTFGAGWTFDAGTLMADHNIAGVGELVNDVTGIVPTVEYKVVFEVKNWTAGSVQVKLGGTLGTARGANGTYTEYIEATDATGLSFVPTNTFRGSIDNVYCYEILTGTSIFLDGHIGYVFRIKNVTTWGRVLITAVTDGLHATGLVLSTLGGTGASVAYQEPCWSDQNGFPRIINFHEGRIQYASTYEQPQTMWASKTHYPEVFTPGTDENSPYAFTLSTQRILRWLKTTRLLCMGCMSGESTGIGPNDAAMSVTDPPRIRDETTHGSANLEPVKVNKAILFVQQCEKKIREFSYKYEDDAYTAPDITVLADHMFEEGIIDMAYQQEPYSILWVLTSDFILHGCTYNRETQAIGWFDVETDGDVESLAVIPYDGKDQLWAIIKRTINGTDKRYVEYLDWDINLDCALTYSGVPITAVAGLDHLIGKTVKVVADGAYEGEFVVPPTGIVTIPTAAAEIVAGLSFTPTLVTSRPEIALPNGSSQGLFKGWAKIILRLLNSKGLTVNGQVIPARSTEDAMGEAPDPYSGDFDVESAGWDRDGRITILQTLPQSSQILALFGELTIGDD